MLCSLILFTLLSQRVTSGDDLVPRPAQSGREDA
jgi:hypothetical protein